MESWPQEQWNKILEFLDHDEFKIHLVATMVIAATVYWVVGGLFLLIDYMGKPKFMMQYKIQEGVKSYPITSSQVAELLKVVTFNQLLGIPFLYTMYIIKKQRNTLNHEELPSMSTAVLHSLIFGLASEVTFYYSHRMLHHPLIYKWIHKKHHTWIAPVAYSAAYCHPVEHIISNMMTIGIGPMICGSHIVLLWMTIIYGTLETLVVHSGFHLPFVKSSEFHDFHHLKFNYNYGVNGLMDWIHGTDSLFRTTKQFKRDKRLWSTTPVKTLVP